MHEEPVAKAWEGGVFEAFDVIEVLVVELMVDGRECFGDVGVVHDPTEFGIKLS